MHRLAVIVFCLYSYGVSTVFGLALKDQDLVFHHLTTKDGLSNNNVRAILRDKYGFLWIATESGLNRYDGNDFKVYKVKAHDKHSLAYNNILGIAEDGHGNIWTNHTYGLNIYDRKKDRFYRDANSYIESFGIPHHDKFTTHIDKKGDLWYLTDNKIYVYKFSSQTLTELSTQILLADISSINIADDGQKIYFTLKDRSLWQIDKTEGDIEQLSIKGPSGAAPKTNIYIDNQFGIWLYSGKSTTIHYKPYGDDQWKEVTLTAFENEKDIRIMDVKADASGRLWIGTDHHGLYIYDIFNDQLINLLENPNTPTSIASNNVTFVYQDNDGTIWLGHSKNGVSFYDKSFQSVVNFNDSQCRDVSVIMEDNTGNIWLGTDGYGLYRKSNKKIEKLPFNNKSIVSLLQDSIGRIWIGTFTDGLYCYQNGEYRHYTTDNSKLASNDVWGLQQDRYGNIWIGTLNGGIQHISDKSHYLDSLTDECKEILFPMDMFYDGKDKLYIATVNGLGILDVTTGNCQVHHGNHRGTQGFNNSIITNVYVDTKDNIWMGHSKGLTRWDLKNDSVEYFDEENLLIDNIVRGIVEDNHQNMWVSTSNGISVLSADSVERISGRTFSMRDGFLGDYFNHHAILKLKNGNILFGGRQGLSEVNPVELLEKSRSGNRVLFTGLKIGNDWVQVDSVYDDRKLLVRSTEFTDSLVLDHDDQFITIYFSSGELLYADKVKYACKLVGLGDEWMYLSDYKITFSSIPVGKYDLLVKSRNSDGVWSSEASILKIEVLPPFYMTRLAYLIYFMLATGVILFVWHKARVRSRKKLEQQRDEIRSEQEAHVNEMKLRFFTNISHDLRTPLTLIITPLQSLLNEDLSENLKKRLKTINKNAQHLLSMLNSILDFRKIDIGAETLQLQSGEVTKFIKDVCEPFYSHASESNITFNVTSEGEPLFFKFDANKLKNVVFNLLSNAFKFTPPGGFINVRIKCDPAFFKLEVADSGIGISDDNKKLVFDQFYQCGPSHQGGSGIGLFLVKEYVNLHGGSIEIEDNKPGGSVFTITIPVSDDAINTSNVLNSVNPEAGEYNQSTRRVGVLFVDDNIELCEFIREVLADEYNVFVAHDGMTALEEIDKNDISVVISDVMMPVMDGEELCRRIKTNINWSHIPVILLSAREGENNKLRGLGMGADDYITKPFNLDLLKLRIRKFVEWSEKCHKTFRQVMDVAPSEITITSLDEQLIEKAIKVVEDHISDADFSVEDLGAEIGLSRGHLYKKLVNITGKGPSEFIRLIRLKRSIQLLEQSQMQIAEVAYAVGFNSPKRFTVNFKNEFGKPPSEYLRGRKYS